MAGEIARLCFVAQQNGKKFFNTGEPCAKGHTADRYTSSKTCIECDRIRRSERDKEYQRTYTADFRKRHPEKVSKCVRSWQLAHPEEMAIIRKRYYEKTKTL